MTIRRLAQWSVAVSTIALVALASGADARSGEVDLPFRGTWNGQAADASAVICPPGTDFPGRTVGTGHATHLGRFDLDVWGCVDLFANELVGVASYTAANGDELHLRYDGVWTFHDDGSVTTVATATDAWGTGRFAGVEVTGGDTVTGYPDGTAAGVLAGMLSFGAPTGSQP